MKDQVRNKLAKLWWFPTITGLLSIGIGIWCLLSPSTSLPIMAIFFIAIVFVAGCMNVAYGLINNAPHSNWAWSLCLGIIEVLLAGWLYTLPTAQLTTAFIYGVGIFLIVIAINAICETFMLSSHSNEWVTWLICFLLITLIFAFIFLAGPIADGIAVWLYIGISFITYGIYRIILAFKINRINKRLGLK